MNWKQVAIQDLQRYNQLKVSLQNMAERAQSLDDRMKSVKGASADSTPVMGGGNRYEDNLLNCIVEKERLMMNYSASKRLFNAIQRGLDVLDGHENLVLRRFYISRPEHHVDVLCNELHCEQTQVYRIKEKALYKFTVAEYGLTDY